MKNKKIKFSFSDYFKPIDYWGSKCSNNQDNYDNLPDTEKALHLDMLIKYYGAEALNDKELSDAHRLDIVAITKSNNLVNNLVNNLANKLVGFLAVPYIVGGVDARWWSHPEKKVDLPSITTIDDSTAIPPHPTSTWLGLRNWGSHPAQNTSTWWGLKNWGSHPEKKVDLLKTTTSTESSITTEPHSLYKNVSANTEASPTVGLSWLEWSGIGGTISVVLASIGYGGYYIIKRDRSNYQAHDNASNNDANQSDLGFELVPIDGITTGNRNVDLINKINYFYIKEKFTTTNQSVLVAQVFNEGLHCNSILDVTSKFKNIFAKLDLNGVAALMHIAAAHDENFDGAISNVNTIRYPATWENMPTKDFLVKYHITNPYRSFDELICDANEQQVLMIGDEYMSLNQDDIG